MRRLTAILGLLSLMLAAAAPAWASPARACPNDQFTLMTFAEFRALSIGVGVPEEFLGAAWVAKMTTFDKNGDGLVCIMDLPDTPGHLGAWVFNVVDNAAAH